MVYSGLLNVFSTYTPLEQFDEVSWLSHRVIETLQPYVLFISEREFDASQRYVNSYVDSSITFTDLLLSGFGGITLVLSLVLIGLNSKTVKTFFFIEGFSFLFLLAFIHIFTGTLFTLWFADFFFPYEVIGAGTQEAEFAQFAPQIDLSYGIDEIFVTFILAYFLLGGAESEDEEDFLLNDEADLQLVEEIVAPLFVANLGKDVAENGALYLKVCAIFGFVLVSNLRGRIPYGDTATSSLALTFWVALSVFGSLITLRLRKHGVNYFFSLFRPAGCPFPLIFLLVPIEFISYSFRVVSLAVRLFANRRAGHTLRKVLIGFSYVRFTLGDGYAIAAFLPALVVFVLIFLEIAVAGIQAYIFTILICIYLKDIYAAH